MNTGHLNIQTGGHYGDNTTSHTGGVWPGLTCQVTARGHGHVGTCQERRIGPFGGAVCLEVECE